MYTYTKIGFAATSILALAMTAFAAKSIESDAIAASQTKVSLSQSITAAEQHITQTLNRSGDTWPS